MAKILTRQSFTRATNYVFKDGRSEVIDSRDIIATDPLSAASCFNVQAMLRPEIKSPVGHICISFHPDDTSRLINELMVEICKSYMAGMGIKDTQYLLVRHYDTDHPHMHLVYNRIDDNGKLISDKMSYIKNEKVCKQLKTKYGLTFSPGKQNVKLDRLRSEDRKRYEMFHDVKNALDGASSFIDFQQRLSSVGITATLKTTTSGKVQGITFNRDGYSIKGSKLDRSLSAAKILERLKTVEKAKHERAEQKSIETCQHEMLHEKHHESRAQELAASLFEANLGASQEQEMKDDSKKKKKTGIRRR